MFTRIALAAGAALALLPSGAQGQAAPGNNVDERLRQQNRVMSDREREEAILTGDTDIVLLRRTQLFSLHGSFDAAATSNAFLAPAGRVSDGYAQAQVGLGFATRIGGKVDLFADVGMLGVRYFTYRALDYNALTGLVGAQAGFGRLKVAATYQPAIVLTRDFSARQLTTHRLRLTAALPFQFGPVTVEPSVAGERVLANPSDYRAWAGSANLTVSAPLSRKLPIFAYAAGGYEHRSFDDYFSTLVGVKRIDDSVTASAGLVYRPRRWADVRLSYSFAHNRSTSDVNGYVAHSGTLGLSATLRF